MKRNIKTAAAVLGAGGILLTSTLPVLGYSRRISISGNGSGSVNRLRTNFSRVTKVKQTNNFSSNDNVSVFSSTGGNTIKGTTGGSSTVVTGNSSTYVSIKTNGGYNHTHVESCCHEETCPTPTPEPTVTPTPTETPTPTPTPTPPPQCDEEKIWANEVNTNDQGTKKNGEEITDTSRNDDSKALGEPDLQFFSIGKDGSLVVGFASPVYDVEGDDLSVHEVTNGRETYPEEAAVAVSQDGNTWKTLPEMASNKSMEGGDGVALLDISSTGYDQVSYVKIIDATDYSLHGDTADGYDLDAVDAVTLVCEEV